MEFKVSLGLSSCRPAWGKGGQKLPGDYWVLKLPRRGFEVNCEAATCDVTTWCQQFQSDAFVTLQMHWKVSKIETNEKEVAFRLGLAALMELRCYCAGTLLVLWREWQLSICLNLHHLLTTRCEVFFKTVKQQETFTVFSPFVECVVVCYFQLPVRNILGLIQ